MSIRRKFLPQIMAFGRRAWCFFLVAIILAIILYVDSPLKRLRVSSNSGFRIIAAKFPVETSSEQHSAIETTPTPSSILSTADEVIATHGQTWAFNHTRDSIAYELTSEQCDTAFSVLFTEIERAVEYQKKYREITPEDLDLSWKKDGAFRAMIFDQQVCFTGQNCIRLV
jgi:hypothetical protein